MLRRDTSAKFEKSGFWIFGQYRFEAGGLRTDRGWSLARGRDLLARQQETPVALMHDEDRRRSWWMFQDEFYWEDESFSELEVKALSLERLTQKDRRVKRAVALMEQTEVFNGAPRGPIADEVKVFVWNRDAGRCVRCGSNERLEFDHVIPIAMGGANTARNLQLLCEACNRAKGASLV
jgi:hypothetical protein